MADIPLAPPTPSPSTAATAAASPGIIAVQVAVTNVPLALQDLTRTIQANATPLIVADANNLTLATILGNITVALSQQLGVAEKQTLTQQLISLMQVQRSLTLTLQPGSPPTQGALLFPMTSFAPSIQNVQERGYTPASATQAKPLAAGSDFRAVVLPSFPAPAAVLAEAPSAATLTTLATRRPINPSPVTENIFTVFAPFMGNSEPPVANQPPTNVVQQPLAPPAPPAAPAVQQTVVLSQPGQSIQQKPILQTIVSPPAQPTSSLPQTSMPPVPLTPVGIQQSVFPNVAQAPQPTPQTVLPNITQASPPVSKTPLPVRPQIQAEPPQGQSANIPIQQAQAPPPAPPLQTPLPPVPPTPVPPKAAAPAPSAAFAPEPAIFIPNVQPPPTHVSSLLTPGNEVALHVVSVLPNFPDASGRQAPLPLLASNQIVATVTGTGTDGQLILKAGDATLFVKSQIIAPAGTSVIVSVDQVKNTSLVTLPSADGPAFQSLQHVLAALEQISPRVLQNVMLNFLPRPTDALPGALLFLLSAFKQGNVRDWLGDNTVDILANAGKSDVVRSLSKELSAAGQPAQDAVVGEWRTYPIPLYAGQQFQSLTLYVHSDRDARKDKAQNAAGAGKIRFVIDMRMSKLGAMQIDGFVQKKKLDMILRSENVLPEGLHRELRQGYIKALDAVGYTGTLNFQVGRHHWMVMQKSAPAGIVT